MHRLKFNCLFGFVTVSPNLDASENVLALLVCGLDVVFIGEGERVGRTKRFCPQPIDVKRSSLESEDVGTLVESCKF